MYRTIRAFSVIAGVCAMQGALSTNSAKSERRVPSALEQPLHIVSTLSDRLKANPSDGDTLRELKRIAAGSKGMEGVQVQAVAALAAAGAKHPHDLAQDLVPFFIAMAKNPRADMKREAAGALGAFGKDGKEGVDTLLRLVDEGRGRDIEAMAVRSLGLIGEEPERVVPVLAALIPNRDSKTGRPVFIR